MDEQFWIFEDVELSKQYMRMTFAPLQDVWEYAKWINAYLTDYSMEKKQFQKKIVIRCFITVQNGS